MPLRPSRRLPKAYQRTSSAFSRKIARKHVRKRGSRGLQFHMTKLNRQWKRLSRSVRVSLRSLKIWAAATVICAILALLLYALFSPTFAISSMHVSRQDRRVDIEEVQELLKSYFGKHILFVSPLLIERQIETQYPEVSTVEVRRVYPDELSVRIALDPIAAEVLIGEPDHTEADYALVADLLNQENRETPYTYLTEEGVFLEYPFPVSPEEGEDRFVIHLVDWAVKPTHRQQLLKPETLQEIATVRRILLQSFGHSIPYITFYKRAQEFHVQTERLSLWFDLANPVVQQINRYRLFLQTVDPGSVTQYVDLRLNDRIVYR